ncbi:MAG: hypothetical protein ABEJ36_00280 [Candidatus Nanosalina sp.]
MSFYGKSTFQNGFGYFEEYRDPDDIGVRDLYAELGLKGLESLGGQENEITADYLESLAEDLDDLETSPEQIASEAAYVERPPRPGVENLVAEIAEALEAVEPNQIEEMSDEAEQWYRKALPAWKIHGYE